MLILVCEAVGSIINLKEINWMNLITLNAKSIMGMMTLSLYSGDTVTVSASGADEEEAIANIEKFLSSK